MRMLRNHAALCKDTARFVPEVDPAAVDTALRVCVHALLTAGESDAEADAVVQVGPMGVSASEGALFERAEKPSRSPGCMNKESRSHGSHSLTK